MADLNYEQSGGDAAGTEVMKVLLQDFVTAEHPLDEGMGAWNYRTCFDAIVMRSASLSITKHQAEWRAELDAWRISEGKSPVFRPNQPTTGPSTVRGRLSRKNRWLVFPDDSLYVDRALTAFRLAHMCSRGEDVRPFLDWCMPRVSRVRVLTMCQNMFELGPAQGRDGLALLAPLCAERGLLIGAVAVADTKRADGSNSFPGFSARAHCTAIGQLADQFDNILFEGWNEPLQHWQPATPAEIREAISDVPQSVMVAYGAPDGPDDESTAYISDRSNYGTSHTDRGRDGYGKVRHIREQQVIADQLKIYMIDDEPENAKNLTAPQLFACGGIAAVCGIGQLHHADFGRMCSMPTYSEGESFAARQRGWATVPQTWRGVFANYGWTSPNPEPPIAEAEFHNADGRCFSSVNNDEAYVVFVNARPLRWKANWRAERVDGYGDESSVYQCRRI